jgi:hypothetical protein
MPERKADITVGVSSASGQLKFSEMTREERKARRAQVLERGMAADRLQVALPTGVYGEWFHNSPEEIYRAQSLGFVIDTEYAHKRALHSEGDTKAIVGDVIFMTCDEETKQDIDEFKKRKYDEIHGKKGAKRETPEERQYVESLAGTPLPAISGGSESSVSAADIANAVKSK